jgi:hypothetical protein
LGPLVNGMWRRESLPWIIVMDEANVRPKYEINVVANATAFDAMITAVPLFSNIRVLHKSYEFVRDNVEINRHLLWSHWFLEMAAQIDPRFRHDIRLLAKTIQEAAAGAYGSLQGVVYEVKQPGKRWKIEFKAEQGNTLFAIFRSFFWEHAKESLKTLQASKDPEDVTRAKLLGNLLSDALRVDVVVLLCLVPFERVAGFEEICKEAGRKQLPNLQEAFWVVEHQFGNLLAS